MKSRIFFAIVLGSFLSACQAAPDGAAEPEVKQVTEKESQTELLADGSACGHVAMKNFTSVEQHEVGRSPMGEVKGHWAINFDQSRFRWRYSDVVEMGSYNCDSGLLTLVTPSGQERATGNFDPDRGHLIINNVVYAILP